MLSNEVMGAFCLGVVWLNTLLVVAHVWQTAGAVRTDVATLGPIVRARVIDAGQGGALAELRVAQIGRAITTSGPERVLFTEASRTATVHEGVVEIEGARARVEAGDAVRVWVLSGVPSRGDVAFDEAFAAASTNKGLSSAVALRAGAEGQEVWLAGAREDDVIRVRLVSDRDPHAVAASARAQALGFAVVALALLVGITALALVRPWFSGWSTLGGALAVAYFLAVQPLAVALREAMGPPDQRLVGGVWQRPA